MYFFNQNANLKRYRDSIIEKINYLRNNSKFVFQVKKEKETLSEYISKRHHF